MSTDRAERLLNKIFGPVGSPQSPAPRKPQTRQDRLRALIKEYNRRRLQLLKKVMG